ncbi:MAG: SRPBCC domain-containing protein, partial [Gemmatimonadaceae bacterium]
EVVPNERIVRTFEWDGMPGYPILTTTILEDAGAGKTRIISLSLFYTTEDRDGMLKSGMEGGLSQSYNALDALLARDS